MTNTEKIAHYETILEIRKKIGTCFGMVDGLFALHQLDEDNAKAHRKLAYEKKITLQEIQEIILYYLYTKGYSQEHIKKQYEKATKFFSTKLK